MTLQPQPRFSREETQTPWGRESFFQCHPDHKGWILNGKCPPTPGLAASHLVVALVKPGAQLCPRWQSLAPAVSLSVGFSGCHRWSPKYLQCPLLSSSTLRKLYSKSLSCPSLRDMGIVPQSGSHTVAGCAGQTRCLHLGQAAG